MIHTFSWLLRNNTSEQPTSRTVPRTVQRIELPRAARIHLLYAFLASVGVAEVFTCIDLKRDADTAAVVSERQWKVNGGEMIDRSS
jgi:hypothetical protein